MKKIDDFDTNLNYVARCMKSRWVVRVVLSTESECEHSALPSPGQQIIGWKFGRYNR